MVKAGLVPFEILWRHLDVIKDVVLLVRLLQAIGGLNALIPLTQFSSVVRTSRSEPLTNISWSVEVT